jgi:two-component system, OmpR family, alkaline phosphatase synthesis response regulator PhoP
MKKIVIAEDDIFLANAYRVKFSKAGFDTKIASDGDEALNVIRESHPDLVILDLMMPIRDGFSTLEEMKRDDEIKTIPVIIASNLGQKEDIEKGMRLGARDFIIKSSMSLDAMVDKVRALIPT